MSRRGISLGRIFGVPIELDYTWFLIFILVTWTLAAGYFPAEFGNWPVAEYWLVGAATSILFFASVVLHELGHALVARRYQIPVKKINLFIFGGVSEIEAEPPNAGAEFWLAVTGPLVSFALAGFFAVVQPLVSRAVPVLALAKYLAYINLVLGIFNLVPGFPLDGGRVFRAAVWGATRSLRRATVIAGNVGRLIGFLLILFGFWQVLNGNLINGLWFGFIGWFLEGAAVAQIHAQEIQGLLAGHQVSEAMNRQYMPISPDTTLQQLVDEHILGSGRRSFIIQRDEQVVGLLTLHGIKEVPRSQWAMTTAAQAMIPIGEVKRVPPEAPLASALEEMDRNGVNQLPVMTDGKAEGLLSREDVISFMRTLREFSKN